MGGPPEGVAQRLPCLSHQSGLADGWLLEASKTLLGAGRMDGRLSNGKGSGLGHQGRTSPQGGTMRFEWQVDVTKADGSLCPARQVADPTVDGSMLLVPGRLAGRCGIGDGLLGGTVGRPSQEVACTSGQTGGPAAVGCS